MTTQELALQNAAPVDTVGDIMLNAPLLHEIGKLASVMAKNEVTVPKHLQGKPNDCYAVVLQAIQWRMNPFAVAQKTHLVNGTLGYEAQLVNAVVQNLGLINGHFHYDFRGDGTDLECRVGACMKGDTEVTWGEWLKSSSVTTKNSPLWKTNPKQQLGYLQLKNFARLYCPGAMLGVYTVDELQDMPPPEREVGPGATEPPEKHAGSRSNALADRLAAEEPQDVAPEPEPEAAAEEASEEPPAEAYTFAHVADAINKATNHAELSELANTLVPDFLHEGENSQYRKELMDLYKARQQELQVIEDEKALAKK